MKRTILAGLAVMALAAVPLTAPAADEVTPQTLTFSNIREQDESYASQLYYFVGTTLRLTNCQAFSDTAGAVTQGLDSVTVTVSVGNTTTNIDYSATVTSTNGGLWSADIVVPDLSTFYIQTKLVDASTNTYIYPWKYGRSKTAM